MELLTVEEAAKLLKVTRRTVTRMIETKRLKAQNVGFGKERKFYRISKEELMKIKNGSVKR